MKSGTGPSTQQPKLPDKTDPSQAKDQDKVEGVTQSMNGVGEHKLSREKQGSQASLVGSARSKGSARLLNAQRVKQSIQAKPLGTPLDTPVQGHQKGGGAASLDGTGASGVLDSKAQTYSQSSRAKRKSCLFSFLCCSTPQN